MDHSQTGPWYCDGNKTPPGGAWLGHMLPGVMFVVWSAHWIQGSMRQFYAAHRAGVSYESKATWSLPGLPDWPLEGIVKVVLSCIGMIGEVSSFAHEDYQHLLCYANEKRHGHFNGGSLNNWQHLQMYMCFAVSGVADIVAHYGMLPAGTDKVFLALAFAGETVLMGLHAKDEALDKFLHQGLTYLMIMCMVACMLEVALPNSYLASCARNAGVMLQGINFIETAQIMYDGYKPAWDVTSGPHGHDMAPAMYAHVVMLQTLATVFAVYVGLHMAVSMFLQWRR